MSGGSVRDAIKTYCPRFLQAAVGEKFMYVFGLACDALLEKLNQGMKMHIPTYGDASALGAIGNDRLIPQGYQETSAGYAQRLKFAYDDWGRAGTAWSVMRQVLGYLSPTSVVVRLVGNGAGAATPWWTYYAGSDTRQSPPSHLNVSAPNWNWDNYSSAWWRIWVIVYAPWTAEGTWGDGQTYGDGGAWGITATPNQCKSIQSIVQLWKPAAYNCVNVLVPFSSSLYDPSLAFGNANLPDGYQTLSYKISGGVAVATRLTNVAYLDGAT